MEYALGEILFLRDWSRKSVLILVLMEYALRGQKLKTPCLSVFQDYYFLFLLQTAQKTCLIFADAKLQNINNMSKSIFVNTS